MATTKKTIETPIAVNPTAITPASVKAGTIPPLAKLASTAVAPTAAPKAAAETAAKRVAKKPAGRTKAATSSEVKAAVKPVVKSTANMSAKASPMLAPETAAKAPVKATSNATQKTKAVKARKVKKPKLVRDTFTIPEAEYAVLNDLKQRAGKLASAVKKSELIRAGVKALATMSDMAFLSALRAVPAIKTGRPSKAKKG